MIGAAALLALSGTALHAESVQGTPEQRQACTPDALNLCNEFIPDVGRVKTCLAEHVDGLSPAFRLVFEQSQKTPQSGAQAELPHRRK